VLHAHLALGCRAPFFRARRLVVSADVVPSMTVIPSAMPRCWTRSSRCSQTPRLARRMNNCAASHHGPSSAGMLRHFAPSWCRQRSPRSFAAAPSAPSYLAAALPRSAFPNRPRRVRQNLNAVPFCHAASMGTVFKL
jgi:hypothetical protein